MRLTSTVSIGLSAAALFLLASPAGAAHRTAQSLHCSQEASRERITGSKRTAFLRTCLKGTNDAKTPTAPTAASKEAQAVTKPSGVDRTTRSKQCDMEADQKHLADKDRSAFRMSCMATAGPVSEGETGTKQPHPSNQINGIGENNYKPSATTAKSSPNMNPPKIAEPKR